MISCSILFIIANIAGATVVMPTDDAVIDPKLLNEGPPITAIASAPRKTSQVGGKLNTL